MRLTARAPRGLLALLLVGLAAAPSACGLASRPADGAPPRVAPQPAPSSPVLARNDAFLGDLQEASFRYFWDLASPRTCLVPDRHPTPSFSSVAAVGFGLTAIPVAVERGWVTREAARDRVFRTLRFFADAPQGPAPAGMTGYRGFFYHFLDMETGQRFEKVELSSIDTALFLSGALFCREYFDGAHPDEAAIRDTADALYRRVEWDWMRPRPPRIAMAWTPEEGFGVSDWWGYDEGMILHVLALGSPTHPVGPEVWDAFTSSYVWAENHGQAYVQFAPLFGFQFSHVWIDFRGIQDAYMRARGIDYFENSRRATYAHRAYAAANPGGFAGYGADVWGLTACDGPADVTLDVGGRRVRFLTYGARGTSTTWTNDDGTIAPTAAAGSIPFAPEIAIPALRAMKERWGAHLWGTYGPLDAFNPTFTFTDVPVHHGRVVPGVGWFDTDWLGIDQGPIVAMIENHRSGLVWSAMRKSPYVAAGLRRAGFEGGWLAAAP